MKKMMMGMAVAAAMTVGAAAAVTFDPATGTGFVGKGDVQLALGMNNAQLQAAARSLAFTYSDEATYDVPCWKEVQNRRETVINRKTYQRSRQVNGSVAYDVRAKNQVSGFNLIGYSSFSSTGGNLSCPSGWEADGDPILVGASGGVLAVNTVPLQ